MKVNVNYGNCASTGSCVQICPEVFELRSDNFLYILKEEPDESLQDMVREAAAACPTAAIELED